jgi:hypothetical protein
MLEQFQKSNRKIVETGKINTTKSQILDLSPFWFGTATSIKKRCGVKKID